MIPPKEQLEKEFAIKILKYLKNLKVVVGGETYRVSGKVKVERFELWNALSAVKL